VPEQEEEDQDEEAPKGVVTTRRVFMVWGLDLGLGVYGAGGGDDRGMCRWRG